MTNLTKAQQRALQIASEGGVVGLGPHAATVRVLRARGLLSEHRDALGHFTLTEAGKAEHAKSQESAT